MRRGRRRGGGRFKYLFLIPLVAVVFLTYNYWAVIEETLRVNTAGSHERGKSETVAQVQLEQSFLPADETASAVTAAPAVAASAQQTAAAAEDKHPKKGRPGGKKRPSTPSSTCCRTISVVLPCAEEREYAVRTVESIIANTPDDVLDQVVVVDDGSQKPLSNLLGGRRKVQVMRHDQTMGIMRSRKTGADAVTSDVIALFDCHVAPQPGWHVEILKLISQNSKRMVVPKITDLDIDTWTQKPNSAGNVKCWLTWDVDFKWFNDPSPEVPIMSGGLLALSRDWWAQTGGYDKEMRGWGGENLDQSLRSWLCGGEIYSALTSEVAHMWRTGDSRTAARYRSSGGKTSNFARVVDAWFGPFAELAPKHLQGRGGDISEYRAIQERLQCKPFVHFLHHFRSIYIDGGIIAKEWFRIRDEKTGQCIVNGGSGPKMGECTVDRGSWWRKSNRQVASGQCCSGISVAEVDNCWDYIDGSRGVHYYGCDITGQNGNQQYRLQDGLLHKDLTKRCLVVQNGYLMEDDCVAAREKHTFSTIDAKEPRPYQIYTKATQEANLA
mmetsp:Transcript_108431/g.248536  ORF Transcript_108431/g.248536 Transcript_108431/m.248536 type:complete len:553 (+) Transcript_108431:26-1684(+)